MLKIQSCFTVCAALLFLATSAPAIVTVSLSGTVYDINGIAVPEAALSLVGRSVSTVSDSAGKFELVENPNAAGRGMQNSPTGIIGCANGRVTVAGLVPGILDIEVFNAKGAVLARSSHRTAPGISSVDAGAGRFGAGLLLIRARHNGTEKTYKYTSCGNDAQAGAAIPASSFSEAAPLSRSAVVAAIDSIRCECPGYVTRTVPIGSYFESNLVIIMLAGNSAPVIEDQNALSCPEDSFLTISAANLSISDADGDTAFVIAAAAGPHYTLQGLKVIPDADFSGELRVPVTAQDWDRAVSDTFHMTVTVVAVNDAPVTSALSNASVQVGRSVSRSLTIVDPDDTAFTVTVLGNPAANTTYDAAAHTITFSADRTRYAASQTVNLTIGVSDGTATDTVAWTISTTAHVWDDLGILNPKATLMKALSANVLFIADSNSDVTKYTISGTTATQGGSYSFPSGYQPLEMATANDSLVVFSSKTRLQSYPTTGIASLSLSAFPAVYGFINIDTAYGEYNKAAWGPGMKGLVRTFLSPNSGSALFDHHTGTRIALNTTANDIDVAHSGGTAFCVLNGPFVYRKLGFNGTWTAVKEPSVSFQAVFTTVETADSLGDTLYLIDNAGDLWKVADGLSAFSPVKVSPTRTTTSICAISPEAAWRIDATGDVQLTINGFTTESRENFAQGSIREIILADDNETLFAFGTDGRVFRY